MRKLYFAILLLCGVSATAFGQSGITTLYASGPSGSGRTGSSTSTIRTEGTMTVSTAGPVVSRAWAVFDLASLPADAVIKSVRIGFNVATYSVGSGSTYNTYGYPGDISLLGTAAATFPAMVAPTSTLLTTESYVFGTGTRFLLSTPQAETFVQSHMGSKISITYTTGTNRVYGITDELGALDTFGAHAPYLMVEYSCASLTGVSAVASPVCMGGTTTLTGAATNASSYSWSGPTGMLSATTTATAMPTATESYTFSITSATTGCTEDSVISVTPNPLPPATTAASGPTAICVGSTVDLSVSAPLPAYTYQWYDGGIAISGATNSIYTADTTGNYAVTIVNSTTGCSATSSGIPVLALDMPTLTPSGLVHVCTTGGGSALLTVNTGGVTSGLTYQWKKDGVAISGATDATYVATAAGNYIAEVSTSGGGCVVNTTATTVDLAPYPNPAVTFNGSVVSTTNTYLNYQWYLNSVAITGATSYNYVPTMNGTYRVRVTSTAGCVNYSAPLAIGNVGVVDQHLADINIYPNPATNIVRIDAAYIVNAVVTTLDGRKIMEKKAATELSISHLPDGIYLIRLYDQDGQQLAVHKLVKE